jgi:hypothetical protein
MPSARSNGQENFWYSWDHGMVHFVVINTETDFPDAPGFPWGHEKRENAGPFAPNGTQLSWLETDLAGVDRERTPWIVVAGHRPWLSSNPVCKPCQKAFQGILDRFKVDIVLSGHIHLYERLAVTGKSTIGDHSAESWHIVNGAAGHYDGLDKFRGPPIEASRKVIDTVYGWSLFEVHNCTHLSTTFIASGNNSVLDHATLFKDRVC